MAFRGVIPRLQQAAGKMLKPCTRNQQHVRNYWNRHLPVWRRHPLEEFFGDRGPLSWSSRMMEKHMRDFDNMLEEMAPRSWWVYNKTNPREASVKYNDKVFEVEVDVGHFEPEELNIKVVGDKLTISAKHEKSDDNGHVSREFTRHFVIPQDVETESLESLLTSDGTLVIKGNVKAKDIKERIINIEHEAPKESPEETTEPTDKTQN